MMSLYEALQGRGYAFRQHLEEEGWTRRKLTVVDLDDSQRVALERNGLDGLRAALESQGLWSFPALDIERPLPIQPDVVLAEDGRPMATVVAPASECVPRQMAQEFIDAVQEQFGLKLILLDDREAELSLIQSQHIILFGGSHENRFAMDVAMRYQTLFVDAAVPGDTPPALLPPRPRGGRRAGGEPKGWSLGPPRGRGGLGRHDPCWAGRFRFQYRTGHRRAIVSPGGDGVPTPEHGPRRSSRPAAPHPLHHS